MCACQATSNIGLIATISNQVVVLKQYIFTSEHDPLVKGQQILLQLHYESLGYRIELIVKSTSTSLYIHSIRSSYMQFISI